jgi:hypothetical protein
MSAALKARTGGGQIASNCRIVTLLMAPTRSRAARSPRSDSVSLLDTDRPADRDEGSDRTNHEYDGNGNHRCF